MAALESLCSDVHSGGACHFSQVWLRTVLEEPDPLPSSSFFSHFLKFQQCLLKENQEMVLQVIAQTLSLLQMEKSL